MDKNKLALLALNPKSNVPEDPVSSVTVTYTSESVIQTAFPPLNLPTVSRPSWGKKNSMHRRNTNASGGGWFQSSTVYPHRQFTRRSLHISRHLDCSPLFHILPPTPSILSLSFPFVLCINEIQNALPWNTVRNQRHLQSCAYAQGTASQVPVKSLHP